MIDVAAIIALGFWAIVVALVAWDEARREGPTCDDREARRTFDERHARELAGRDC